MAVAAVLPVPIQQFFGTDGTPLSGGLLYSFQAGTSGLVEQALYTNIGLTLPYPNPIVLNTAGRTSGPVYPLSSPAYDIVLKTSAGVTVWSATNIIAVLGAD